MPRPPISSPLIAIAVVLTASIPTRADSKPAEKVDFNFQVRSILSDRCFNCHGPDPRNRKAGLRLDTRDGAMGETKSGNRAVVPGNLEESELVARITAEDPHDRMPPDSLGRPLSAAEVETLKKWIAQGAEWKSHWSFIAPEKARIPTVRDPARVRNPIDAFVLARLDSEAVAPAAEATRERLIRRLSFDLAGLPPTIAEVDAFLADTRPDAYERLVDRLLESPHYGERMAVDWLDLARYADTHGYQADVYRDAWPWRDWVVRAFNTNLPYDQFLTWQLAGDLLPRPTRDQVLATAFNRHHRQTNEGGSIEEEFRVEYVADRTITFGATFLGLTLECARCHSHKYDPITQKDFYSLSSFFNNIDESGLTSHFTTAVPTPTLLLPDDQQERQISQAEQTLKKAEADFAALIPTRKPAFEAWLNNPQRLRKPVVDAPGSDVIPGRIGAFSLDAIQDGKVENRVDPKKPGQVSERPEVVVGAVGNGLKLSGENNVVVPMGNFDRTDPFSIAIRINVPDHKDRAVVFHRSPAWTDAASRGYELLLEDGKLSAALVHFWPGNAIRIRARQPLPIGKWVHVAMTYDGSSRANGLKLYLDGKPVDCEVVRDKLTKNITGGGGDNLTLGQRMRDRGFKDGRVDELEVFDRELTPIEAAQDFDGASLSKALAAEPARLDPATREALFKYYLAAVDSDVRAALVSLRSLRQARSRLVDPVPEIMVMRELPKPKPAFLLKRGAYDAPGEPVSAATPVSLLTFSKDWPNNRLGLAKWLTDPRHSLTSRVAVNRWWQALFGRGIVATPEDFGSQGQLPSHPELLDWLARDFIDTGWDVKRLIRLIVTSSTYRQASEASPELTAHDPDNALLASGPRFRLSAEMIRDNALAASGLLVDAMGGPPVKPFQPAGLWEEKSGTVYTRDVGPGSHRRSLYTFWKRTSPPPSMLTFDATSREVCVARRLPTDTPLQALVLLNDPQYVEAARVLAQRASREAGGGLDDRIAFIFRTLTGRRPVDRELTTLETLYREQYDEFRSGRSDPSKLLAEGDAPRDASLDPAEHAALTVLAQALFSFDETVMNR